MDRAPSDSDLYEDWPSHRLIDLLCLISRILQQRQQSGGGEPVEESPGWRNRSDAGSTSSWSVMSGPPCTSIHGPSLRSSPAPSGYQVGGASGRGRDAGPIAPFVCGYSCQFCQAVCSRNKNSHSHHRCREHRNL